MFSSDANSDYKRDQHWNPGYSFIPDQCTVEFWRLKEQTCTYQLRNLYPQNETKTEMMVNTTIPTL